MHRLAARRITVDAVEEEGGYSPVAMAILGHNPVSALELLDSGVDCHRSSRAGRSLIYLATEKGMCDVVRKLVAAGVDVDAPATEEANQVRPLHVALLHRQQSMVPALIALKADVDIRESDRGCSPLLLAVLLGDDYSAECLLRAGASPALTTTEGRNAVYCAAEKGRDNILRLLAARSVDLNAAATTEADRSTALHVAATRNDSALVWQLHLMGADLGVK
jgi:ankyrin repeat protein